MDSGKKVTPAALIGFFATVVFTMIIHIMPLLGFAKIDLSREITNRLFSEVRHFYLFGHLLHYTAGTALAVIYVLWGREWIKTLIKKTDLQNGPVYGLIWSLFAYILSFVFLLLIGRGNVILTTGVLTLLCAHLLYGFLIGVFLDYD